MLKVAIRSRGKSIKVYVQNFHTNGAAQRRFTEAYGRTSGACVRAGVHKGMTQEAIRNVVRGCALRKPIFGRQQ